MRHWKSSLCLMLALFGMACSAFPALAEETPLKTSTAVVVYGGTPGGIAAALAAGGEGAEVLLIEPYSRVGGLMTNGLSHADFRTFEGLTGTYLQFTTQVQNYYQQIYGTDSEEAECFRGTHAEPHVNQLIFEQMLSEVPSITVLLRTHLLNVQVERTDETERISRIVVENAAGQQQEITAQIFIDATYEGDLLAKAGVPFHVGEEGSSEFGESLAPAVGTNQVQGYNFRLIMTQEPDNRILVQQPEGYRREDFVPLLTLFENKQLKSVFCSPSGGIYKYQPPRLPGNKFDINDVSRGLVRLSLPQINNEWPTGNAQVREKLFQEHLQHQIGMLFFLQTDSAVPEAIQQEALSWGLCKDEFIEHNHLPEQLYVREGRRMQGQYIYTEKDTDHAPDDARAVLHTDAIAMGDYGPNCHGTYHEGARLGGKHAGEFYKRVSPYQIPYGVLVPRKCTNLLVPVACSSSHVGFCALRLEPIWMSLGQAAGVAAEQALAKQIPVQQVNVKKVQARLHHQGGATIYFSDVLPNHPQFVAAQWWGTLGGFHQLHPAPATPGERGKHFFGQYYEAFPGHTADLDEPLTGPLLQRWTKLAESQELVVPSDFLGTRGEFLKMLYEQSLSKS